MNGYLNNMGINLIEGRLPENDTEVVISEHISTNGGVKYKVGDTLYLDVCDRVDDNGNKLTQQDEFNTDIKETLIKKYTKTYKIVGIMERPSYATENYSAAGYTVITKMSEVSDNANIAVVYKDASKYEEDTENIAGLKNEGETGEPFSISGLGFYDTKKYDVRLNVQLLTYEGVAMSDNTSETLYTLAAVIIVIILVSSVFVIKNGFAISITERLKQYGMLASIGATKKQIKKSVYFEGMVLGLIRNTTRNIFWHNCNSCTFESN